MEIKELRIGNIIECDGFIGVITTFNNNQCVIKNKSGIKKCYVSICEPIPLTEECLLKFGFEQLNKQPIYTIRVGENIDNKIKLGISIDGWFGICYDGLIYQGINDNKIKYVHQLQNLYFALTNEELTWK